MKTLAIVATGMMTALGGVADVRAADRHLAHVANDLRHQTAVLVREIRYGYRFHPEFDHLYSDAVEMCQHADRVFLIAAGRCSINELAAETQALDELFHHVEEVIAAADATGRFHVNAYHQRRACQVMESIEVTLHHLLDDVTPVPAPVIPAPVVPAPVHPRHPVLPTTPTIYQPRPVIRTPRYEVLPHRSGRAAAFTWQSRDGRFSIAIGR